VGPHPIGLALDVDHRGVVQQAVEDRSGDDLIGEHLAPVAEAAGRSPWPTSGTTCWMRSGDVGSSKTASSRMRRPGGSASDMA